MPVFSHNLLIFWHCMVHTMTDKSLAHWELLSEDLSAQHCLPISETFVNKVVWGMTHPTARVTPLSGSRFADTSQNLAISISGSRFLSMSVAIARHHGEEEIQALLTLGLFISIVNACKPF